MAEEVLRRPLRIAAKRCWRSCFPKGRPPVPLADPAHCPWSAMSAVPVPVPMPVPVAALSTPLKLLGSPAARQNPPRRCFSSSSTAPPSRKFSQLPTSELAELAISNARGGAKRDLKVFDILSERFRTEEGTLETSQLVQLAWAIAKSRVRQPGLLDSLAAKVIPELPTLDGRSVATLAWSFAKLSLRRGHLEILEAADLASDADRLAGFKPQDISIILWSCGSARYAEKATLDAILATAQERIGEFGSQGLSNMLWALGKLDYEHHGFVDAFSKRVLEEGGEGFSPQELANSAWALAKLKRKDADVMAVLTDQAVQVWETTSGSTNAADAANATRTSRGFRPQELSNLTWAAAKLDCSESMFSKFWEAASRFSISSMSELGPQELAMIAWAFATVDRQDLQLLDSIASAVAALDSKGNIKGEHSHRKGINKASLNEQDCANLLWAYASLKVRDPVLLRSVLSRIETLQSADGDRRKVGGGDGGLSPQNLATVCWSLATLRVEEEQKELWRTLLLASSQAAEEGEMRHPQDLAGVLWAVATVPTVLGASTSSSLERSFSSLRLQHLVEAAVKCSQAWKPQDVSNLAWACSTLECRDGSLWEDVREVVFKRYSKFRVEELEATLVAMCSMNADAAESLAEKLESKRLLTPLGFGALLGSAEERCSLLRQVSWLWSVATAPEHRAGREENPEEDRVGEQQDGLLPARHPFALASLCVAARRLLHAKDVEGARALLEEHATRLPSEDYLSDPVVKKLKHEIGSIGSEGSATTTSSTTTTESSTEGLTELLRRPPGRALAQAARGSKAALLLNYVRSRATFGDPLSVCQCIEQFSVDVLSQKRQWFKIVGPEKAEIMLDAFRTAPADGLLLEIGTYLGYSSMRFAIDNPNRKIVSLEVEPTHALTAQYLIEFAGLQDQIEVWSGHSQTSLRRLKVECEARNQRVSAMFMDQCGSRFWQDFEAVHATGLVNDGAVVIADNVLKPGAPRYLYHLHRGPVSSYFDTKVVSVPEFGMVDVEDWLSVALVKVGRPWQDESVQEVMPEKVAELEWFAKTCRERAEGATGSVPFESWSKHSADMRVEMKKHFDIAPE